MEDLLNMDNPVQQPDIPFVVNKDPEIAPNPGVVKFSDLPDKKPSASVGQVYKPSDQEDMVSNIMTNYYKTKSPYDIAKQTTYDPTKFNIDRYKNWGSLYKELGFNPFRDNESLYNQNSSTFTEFRKAFVPFAALTAMSALDSMTFGSIWNDKEVAKIQEKWMNRGSSTQGGVTGFSANLFMNSGFAIGMLADFVVSEAVMAAVAGASALPTAGAGTAVAVAGMGAKAVSTGNKFVRMYQAGKRITNGLNTISDINAVRNVWQRGLNFINPLENTIDFFKNIQRLDNFSTGEKVVMGLASTYRDINNIKHAWLESGLEGGGVDNEVYDKLVQDELKRSGGISISPEKLAEIEDTASKSGLTTKLFNFGAIFLSNKVVFGNIMKSGGVFRNTTKSVMKSPYARILETGSSQGGKAFKFIKGGYVRGGAMEFLQKVKNPRNWGSLAVKYSAANITEGFQENLQESIGAASKDYYLSSDHPDGFIGGYMHSMLGGLKSQISSTGFETFMSGFLMGGVISGMGGALSGAMGSGSEMLGQFNNRAEYKIKRDAMVSRMKEDAEALNKLHADPVRKFNADLENAAVQRRYQQRIDAAIDNGDVAEKQDAIDDSVFKHVSTAIRTGTIDTFIKRMEDMKSLTNEEISTDYNMSKDEFDAELNKAISRAEGIKKRYDDANRRFPNPYNPKSFEEGSADRRLEELRYISHEMAKEDYVHMGFIYDRTKERMDSIRSRVENERYYPIAKEFGRIFDSNTLQRDIASFRSAIDMVENDTGARTEEFREQYEKDKERLSLTEGFNNSLSKYLNSEKNEDAQKNGEEFKEAILSYVKGMSSLNNVDMPIEDIDELVTDIVDFYYLKDKTSVVKDAISELGEGGFDNHESSVRLALQNAMDNRKKFIEESFDAYVKLNDSSELLNGLLDQGVFLDPKEAKVLMEEKRLPSRIFSSDKKAEIPINSKEYKEAISYIKDFYQDVIGETIYEVTGQYDLARGKLTGDKRTLKDLESEYGFVASDSGSYVEAVKVLRGISESKYSTFWEKELAVKYISLIQNGSGSRGEFVIKITKDTSPELIKAQNPSLYSKLISEYKKSAKKGITTEEVEKGNAFSVWIRNSKEASELISASASTATSGLMIKFKSGLFTNGTYSSESGIVIDPRYNAYNYNLGERGSPIEFAILHQVSVAIIDSAMSKDENFRSEIDKIRLSLLAEIRKEDSEFSYLDNLIPSLGSVEGFAASVMSNYALQSALASMSIETGASTGLTGWEGFSNSLIDFIKTESDSFNPSAINGLLSVITANVDSAYESGIANQTSVVKKKDGSIITVPSSSVIQDKEDYFVIDDSGEREAVEVVSVNKNAPRVSSGVASTISELKSSNNEAYLAILSAFEQKNPGINIETEQGQSMLEEFAALSAEARSIRMSFSAPSVVAETNGGFEVNTIKKNKVEWYRLSVEDRRKYSSLRDKGFDVSEMTIEEVNDLLNRGISVNEYISEKRSQGDFVEDEQIAYIQEVEKEYSSVDESNFEAFQEKIKKYVAEGKIDVIFAEQIFQMKLEEISKSSLININNIKSGTFLQLKSGEIIKVFSQVKERGSQSGVKYYNKTGNLIYMSNEDILANVARVVSKKSEDMGVQKDAESVNASNSSYSTLDEILSSQEDIDEDISRGASLTEDELLNDLFNTIDIC